MTTRSASRCPDPALLLAVDEQVLAPALEARVRAHLAECAGCRETATALRETLDAEPGPEVRAHIAARVQAAASPRRSIIRWAMPVGLLAAAAAAFFIVAAPDLSLPSLTGRPPVSLLTSAGRPTVFHPDLPIFVAGDGTVAMRGEQSDRDAVLTEIGAALDEAEAGRYAEALTKLAAVERRHPGSADVSLAVGTTHLLAGRPAEAIAALDRGRPRTAGTLTDEFDWHLSVAYVMAGTPDRARPRLVVVCEHGGPRSALACAGLAEIAKAPLQQAK